MTERANELGLVFTASISSISSSLSELGTVLDVEGGGSRGFDLVAAKDVAAGPGRVTFAWLKPTGAGFQVLAAQGDGMRVGDVINDERVGPLRDAMASPMLVATPVIGSSRILGFALGPPAAPAGTVLYRETALGPVAPPRQASTAPFHELNVVLYATPRVDPSQVLVTTTPALPLHGRVQYQPVPVGSSSWLLATSARTSLISPTAAAAPWGTLVIGVVAAALVASMIESNRRRRETAEALYISEHRTAETLQRSLLPDLPALPGLDLAAQYLAGAPGQQVGGDWFDVFPVEGDRVGVVIGDVMGHDIAAAAAMSQIRATLRAYAWTGDEPAVVLSHLDQFVTTFALTPLVSVFYGLMDLPDDRGHRPFRYANAGHLSPIVRTSGGVQLLQSSGSTVICGLPAPPRSQETVTLPLDAMLVLFTDGLVERGAEPVDVSVRKLADRVAVATATTAERLCDEVVGNTAAGQLVDDVVVLVVHLLEPVPRSAEHPPAAGAHTYGTTDANAMQRE